VLFARYRTATDYAAADQAELEKVIAPPRVELDVSGVHKDQIDIQLQDRELVVTGEVPESEQEGRAHPPLAPHWIMRQSHLRGV
jgi:HSP20 family molecular chaperone IbpA